MYAAYSGKIIFDPAPGALRRDQKVKYHLISIAKSIFYTKRRVCSHK